MNISEGNGTFTTSVSAANTGSAAISVGSVTNPNAWVSDNYTLTFTDPGTWEITDTATPTPNVVASGPYTSGSTIGFNGVQFVITGTPATGDTFQVSQSRNESVFNTIDRIVDALRTPGGDPSENAKLASTLEKSLQQIDQASDHFLGIRSQVGSRLSALDTADSSREDLNIDIDSALSDLRDLDYAEALALMNQLLVGLQAAQMSYSQISQLSLFNYLR